MAARALTPLGVAAKWLVVPVALGAIGYFLLGPRLGGVVTPSAKTPAKAEKPGFSAPDVDVDSSPASRYANASPEVEVSARERRSRKRRRRSNPVVVEDRDTGREPAENYAAPESKPSVGTVDGV